MSPYVRSDLMVLSTHTQPLFQHDLQKLSTLFTIGNKMSDELLSMQGTLIQFFWVYYNIL